MSTKFTKEELGKFSKEELYNIAQKLNIRGRSKMDQNELVEALTPFASASATKVKAVKKVTTEDKKKSDVSKKTVPASPKKDLVKSAKPDKSAKTEKVEKNSEPEKTTKTEKVAKASKPEKATKTEKVAKASKPEKKVAKESSVAKPAKKVEKASGKIETSIEKKTRVKSPVETEPVEKKKPLSKKNEKAEKAPVKKAVATKAAKNEDAEKSSEKKSLGKAAAKVKEKEDKPAKKEKAEKKPVESSKSPKSDSASKKRKKDLGEELGSDNTESAAKRKTRAKKSEIKKELPVDSEIVETPRLTRSFAKQKNVVDERKKKGAVVQSVAIPVILKDGSEGEKPTPRAQQIEEERSKRHSALKTTMEIPVFSVPSPESATSIKEDDLTGDLPADYGETRIVVQVRDPHWAHAYWQIPRSELKRLELDVGIFEFAHSHFVLRVHNVTDGFSQEFRLTDNARSHYFYLEHANTVYQAELGLQSPTEGYSFVALSNLIQTPPDRVSQFWAAPVGYQPLPEEGRIAGHELSSAKEIPTTIEPGVPALTDPQIVYQHSVAGGDLPAVFMEKSTSGMPQVLSSEGPDQPTIGQPENIDKFDMPDSWNPTSHPFSSYTKVLEVNEKKEEPFISATAEMVLYGTVERNSELSFNGHPVTVGPDGSYSLRVQLPENQGNEIELEVFDPISKKRKMIKASIKFEIS